MQKEVVKLKNCPVFVTYGPAWRVFILDTRIAHRHPRGQPVGNSTDCVIVDSNCDPDHIQYPISRQRRRDSFIKLIISRIADACL